MQHYAGFSLFTAALSRSFLPIPLVCKRVLLQAELQKKVTYIGNSKTALSTDGKESNEKSTNDNRKHHSVLLQVLGGWIHVHVSPCFFDIEDYDIIYS